MPSGEGGNHPILFSPPISWRPHAACRVANFYSSELWPGLVLWLAASLSFVAVHTVLWTKSQGGGRAARFALAAVLMAVPPFGIVGWAHPLTAAGVLFPGWGWAAWRPARPASSS